ncbi:LytR family transcriptional regulator [Occultella glacieicola]|uniref:LytR family transcriptional regulator n=1 Tax=Occultella glacieicola TaxID=2518684 RepID=A0ABY2DZ11_9MICO|nr:LytR C-terminal domain-containing protein [Occultella glacieicola]TDE89209.1 LytR family transcriptional regulator [Occultella glacieicola]
MSTNGNRAAAEARLARRRHLQQRQTVVFGALIAALLVIALTAGAMWVGILPTPVNIPINSPEPTEATAPPGPCPPEGQTYVNFAEITTNVLNGTSRAGLAGTTAAELQARGIVVASQANAESSYAGVVRLVAGPTGLGQAYSVALLFPESTIVLDERADATVDVVLGGTFEMLLPADEVLLDPTVVIPAPQGCEPLPTATG